MNYLWEGAGDRFIFLLGDICALCNIKGDKCNTWKRGTLGEGACKVYYRHDH